jgi:hypothetical protein
MAINDVADQYFAYENRLASFQTAQQLSKRRASNASAKAPKSLRWPHKFLSPEEVRSRSRSYHTISANTREARKSRFLLLSSPNQPR